MLSLSVYVCVGCSVVSNSLWPHGLWPTRLFRPWNSPGKYTGVGSHSLLQGNFLTQGLNLDLLHGRQILYHLSHQGSPYVCVYMHTHIYIHRYIYTQTCTYTHLLKKHFRINCQCYDLLCVCVWSFIHKYLIYLLRIRTFHYLVSI